MADMDDTEYVQTWDRKILAPRRVLDCVKRKEIVDNAVNTILGTGELYTKDECDECGKQFAHKKDVYRHKRTQHADNLIERPILICTDCGQSFTQRNNLIIHERTHTRDQPFPCNICGEKFRLDQHLEKGKNCIIIISRNKKSKVIGIGRWKGKQDWPEEARYLKVVTEMKIFGFTV